MAITHRTFSLAMSDPGGVLEEMRDLALGADGRQWMNIVPDADEREIHTGSALWRILSSRGPVIPKLTWVPAHQVGDRSEGAQVGLAHAAGRDAVSRLASQGMRAPAGWTVVQDHQKRGVIFDLDPAVSPDQILDYGTNALRALSPFRFEEFFIVTFSRR